MNYGEINYEFQKPIANSNGTFYVFDFFISNGKVNLVVEIDGGYHETTFQKRKDKYRDWFTRQVGVHSVLRFTNKEVMDNPMYCLAIVKEYLKPSGIDDANASYAFLKNMSASRLPKKKKQKNKQLFCHHKGSYTLKTNGNCCKCNLPINPNQQKN